MDVVKLKMGQNGLGETTEEQYTETVWDNVSHHFGRSDPSPNHALVLHNCHACLSISLYMVNHQL